MKKISLLIISMLVSIVASAAVGDVFVTGNYRYQITAEATGTDVSGAGAASVLGFSASATAADQANAAIAQYFQKDGKMYIVTEIAPNAFAGNTNITSVSIKGAVAKVGMSAFYGCSNLVKVSLGSVTTLDANAFAHCTSLTSVKIPDTLTGISNAAFDGCTALESFVVVEANPTYSSYDGALYNKKQTILVRMPAAKAEKPTYPVTLKTIYARAYNCYKYPRIELPYGVTTVGSRPFENSEVQVVLIPSSAQTIPADMFYGCSKLIELWSNLSFPPKIEKDVMFAGANIPNLYIPYRKNDEYIKWSGWNFFPNINYQGYYAYDYIQIKDENGANAYFNVTVFSTEPFTAVDGVTYDGRCKLVAGRSSGKRSGDITVPNYIEITGKKYALTRIDELAGVSLNDFSMSGCALIDTINMNAFASSKISSFNFENVSVIGDGAFARCDQLKTVQFGHRIKMIHPSAFASSGLEGDLVLPYGIKTCYNGAFSNTKIRRFFYPGTIFFQGSFGNKLPNAEEVYINRPSSSLKYSLSAYPAGCKFYVPVGEVDAYRALEGAENYVFLPGAFDFAKADSEGFFDTPYACTVTDPEAMTVKLVRTKNAATSSLSTYVVDDVWTDCYPTLAPDKGPVYKITELGDSLFFGCKNYSSISLDSATNLTRIGNRALADMAITTLTIPLNVKAIGDEAFRKTGSSQWTLLQSDILNPATVTMGADVFKGVDYKNCVLQVPRGKVDLYRNCEQWKEFLNIKETPGSVLKGDVSGDGVVDIVDANILINIILGRDDAANYNGRADINNDSLTDVSDINVVLNIILGSYEEPDESHEYVNLGLPSGTRWATTNLGGTAPEHYGQLFAWGDINGQKNDVQYNFSMENYTWYDSDTEKLTKYCYADNKTILDAKDDAATALWGKNWCMPTYEQAVELFDSRYTSFEWTTINGVKGLKVTSKANGNSIFLAATGYRDGYTLKYKDSTGYYWTRMLDVSPQNALYFIVDQDGGDTSYGGVRYRGQAIRPVRK